MVRRLPFTGDFFLALSIKEAQDLEAGNAMAIPNAACDP